MSESDNAGAHPFLQINGLLDGSWFSFFVIAVASSRLGSFAPKIGLPLITGYMFVGCICGPFVLKLVTQPQINDLAYVTQAALAFIAFSAGSELYLPELRSLFRSIAFLSTGTALVTFFTTSFFVYLLGTTPLIPWMRDLDEGCRYAVSFLCGSIMLARSPASAIAVVRELRAKGTITSLFIGVTVVSDVVVIIIFTVCASIALARCSGSGFRGAEFLITMLSLACAVLLGYALGFGLIFLLWVRRVPAKYTILPIGLLVFLVCDWFTLYSLNHWGISVNLDALLICITAGYVVTNRSENRIAFLNLLGSWGPYVFIPFFTKVGAELDLVVFYQTLGMAILVFIIRAGSMWLGSAAAGYVAGMENKQSKTFGLTMLAQAGVSLGLASEVAVKFVDSFGLKFQSSVVAVVLINQIVGPIACGWTLKYHNEDGKMVEEEEGQNNAGSFKRLKRCVVIGVNDRTLAFAQRSLRNDWCVGLVDTDMDKLNLAKELILPEKPHPTTLSVGASWLRDKLAPLTSHFTPRQSTNIASPKQTQGKGKSHAKSKTPKNKYLNLQDEEMSMEMQEDYIQAVEIASQVHPPALDVTSPVALSSSPHSSIDSPADLEYPSTDPTTPRLVRQSLVPTEEDDMNLRIQTYHMPLTSQLTLLGALQSVQDTIGLEPNEVDSVVVSLPNDADVYSICVHLSSTLRLHRVIAHISNAHWSSLLSSYGVIPIHTVSTEAHLLYQASNCSDQAAVTFAPAIGSLPDVMAAVVQPETDERCKLLTMSTDERLRYLSRFPAPSPHEIDAVKPRTVSLMSVVAESQKQDYLEKIHTVHDMTILTSPATTDFAAQSFLGPSTLHQFEVKKEQKRHQQEQLNRRASNVTQEHQPLSPSENEEKLDDVSLDSSEQV